MDNTQEHKNDQILSAEEIADIRRKQFRSQMEKIDVSDVEGQLADQISMQHTRKMSAATLERIKDAHIPKKSDAKVSATAAVEVIDPPGDEGVDKDDNPYRDEIAAVAARTPEVRFTKAQMLRPFDNNELRIIAAALRAGVALYRVADTLHCSIHKIENAIRDVPILSELAQERISRRKQQAMEAVDDCVKARVPAVVMWNAEKILPEIYGSQVNIDNEDDTKLVIGALPESEIEAAEKEIAEKSKYVPEVEVGAVMEAMTEERGAEMAAAGGGVPVSPLNDVPPAPSVNPPDNDPRFTKFVGASELNRLPVASYPQSDPGPDNFGAVGGGGGYDDFDDGSWI